MDRLPSRSDYMPCENQVYTLADLLEILDAEIFTRELIDRSTLDCMVTQTTQLERILDEFVKGGTVRFFKGTYLRMILEKLDNGNFKVCGLFGVPPSNPRSGCSDTLAPTHGFGLSFMALGGNSYPTSH